jgi:type IV pilus assembly protein PilW
VNASQDRIDAARRRQSGLSLIELMVALALGVVLILGLTQVFGSVRASFGAAEGLSRVQENSRFALEFLKRDVRMASHLGCRNEYQLVDVANRRGYYNHLSTSSANTLAGYDSAPYVFQLHRPIEVYDYSAGGGTSPGNTLTAPLAEYPSGVTAASSYTPQLPTALTDGTGNLGADGILGNAARDVVPGSDVLVVRYLNEVGTKLPGVIQQADGVLAGTAAANFPVWTVFGVTNCAAVSLFQVTSAGPPAVSLAAGSANLNRQPWGFDQEPNYSQGSEVYRFEIAVYYVGRTGANTPPALFRLRLRQAPGSAAEAAEFGEAEELIPGVEMMQVLLGVDTEPEDVGCTAVPAPAACSIDDTIDVFRSAAEHMPTSLTTAQQIFDRQRAIKTVRLSLLMRSPEPIPAAPAPASATRTVGDVVVTPPNDRRIRQVYDVSIALRNRVRN